MGEFGASDLQKILSDQVDASLSLSNKEKEDIKYEHIFKPKSETRGQTKVVVAHAKGKILPGLRNIVSREKKYEETVREEHQDDDDDDETYNIKHPSTQEPLVDAKLLEERRLEIRQALRKQEESKKIVIQVPHAPVPHIEEESNDDDDEADARRRRAMNRRRSSSSSSSESSSSGSSSESSSSSSESSIETNRVVFVAKQDRKVVVKPEQRHTIEKTQVESIKQKIERDNERSQKKKVEIVDHINWPDDTDGINEQEEYNAWKLREMARIMRQSNLTSSLTL